MKYIVVKEFNSTQDLEYLAGTHWSGFQDNATRFDTYAEAQRKAATLNAAQLFPKYEPDAWVLVEAIE